MAELVLKRVGLRNFQRHPERLAKYSGREVRIWSDEHCAYWRPKGAGYTTHRAAAGAWSIDDAYGATDHCGPEKRMIIFEFVAAGDLGDAARPLGDYHEDFGAVLWWFFPISEPPYVGTPLDSDWPGYHTHWTELPPLPHKPKRRRAHA